MSSILRTSKFIKLFTGISRNVTLNSARRNILMKAECNQKFSNVFRALATQRVERRKQNETPLERSLRRLDMDVRRSGRISRKELEDVLEEMKHSTSATSSNSLLLIRCCGNLVPEEKPEVRTKLVQEIWKTIESLGIPMDISHYNALLRVYLENNHEFSPAEFLKNLEIKGIEPNRVTYQRLIARYCHKGDIEGATQILQHMKEKQLPVNEGVFNSLIMGHAQSGDMESAKGILGVMGQAGLPPSAETYATLLCGYAKMGDVDSMKNILQDCDAKQIDIIDRDYMDILYVAVRNGHPELVDELLGRMRRVAGYNQDAVNLILKMINDGKEDIAYKILLTMPRPVRTDGDEIPIGNFFLRQLIKAERPIEKILYYCEEMEKNGFNPRAYQIALEACLNMTKLPGQAFPLIEALKNRGQPPRVHFFWPLLASFGQKGDMDGMMEVVVKMFEMKVVPGGETLRDYVIPYLLEKSAKDGKAFNSDSVLSTLRGWGVSPASSANGLASVLVAKMELKEAVDIVRRHKARYSPVALMRPLNTALESTRDYESYATILSQIVNGLDRVRTSGYQEDDAEAIEVEDHGEENAGANSGFARRVVGSYLLDLSGSMNRNRVELFSSLLPALLKCGLGINNSHAEIIQERFGAELTPEISTMLGKLTSADLTPVDFSLEQDNRPMAMEARDLENLLLVQEAKGNPTRGLKKQLLSAYCRSRNIEGANKLLQELEGEKDFLFTDGTIVHLIELFAVSEMPDEALKYHEKLLEMYPATAIDDFKVIKLVECLIKAEKYEDAVKVISKQPSDRKTESRSFGYNSLCWRSLNHLAEAGKVEELEKIFDALISKNFIEPTNILMGPLVNAHLKRNDVEGALKKFEWCSEKYGGTPFKNQLACRLIEAEDAVSLQRITDISTRIHGEVNSLYDLVFAFVECGRLKQARRILETPGLRNRPTRLNSACRRYSEEGMVAALEGLVEATKDLHHIDRSDIYLHLLYSYCKSNDIDKAMGLWTQMQDEDVQPSDEFLISLANLLRKNDMKVPFVEPKPDLSLSVKGQSISSAKETKIEKDSEVSDPMKSPSLQRFRQAIRIGDTDAALQCKSKLEAEGKKMPVKELSLLVEQLVKDDRIGEATAISENYLSSEVRQSGRTISPRVLRFLLSRLANLGDIDSITNIGNLLSPEEKRLVSFDNRLCNAYTVSGKAEEYLKDLDKQIETAKDEDLETIENSFPRGGALGILQNHPELIPMYEEMAKKYAARNIKTPINVLWSHHFSNQDKEAEANAIWNEYLHNYPRVMFQFVCQTARVNKDISLTNRLLELIKEKEVSDVAKGIVHSTKIGIHVNGTQFDEALQTLHEAVKDVSLESINRRVLHRLKQGLENMGKPFPYTIPQQKASSSSSSSSDDEPEKKRV